MPDDKATFYSRDPSLFINGGEATTIKKKYMGVERRCLNRREIDDRREEIRFEMSKEDRRNASSRREADADGRFW